MIQSGHGLHLNLMYSPIIYGPIGAQVTIQCNKYAIMYIELQFD